MAEEEEPVRVSFDVLDEEDRSSLADLEEELDEEERVKQRNMRAEKLARIQEQLVKENKLKLGMTQMLALYSNKHNAAYKDVQIQLDAVNQRILLLTRQMDAYKQTVADPLSRRKKLSAGESSGGVDVALRKSTSVSHMPVSWRYKLNHFRNETISGTGVRKRPALLNIMKGLLPNLSEALDKLKAKSENPQARLDAINNLLKIVRSARLEQNSQHVEDVLSTATTCLNDPSQEVRASGYRVIRHMLHDKEAAQLSWKFGLEFHLLRALARDSKGDVEREQAFKLVRAYIDCPSGVEFLPRSIVATIAVSTEQSEDKFRPIAIETICELAVRSTELILACDGLRCIFQVLLDGPRLMVDLVVPTIVYILDRPETRQYIRPSVEIEIVLSNFTDTYSRGQSTLPDRLESAAKATAGLFKTWTGLIYLCLDHRNAIKTFIEALRLPHDDTKKIILDAIFEIFRLDVPKFLPELLSARRSTAFVPYNVETVAEVSVDEDGYSTASGERTNLLDHHLALLLVVFIDANLFDALVDTIESSSKPIATRAMILVGQLLRLCSRILPVAHSARVQSLGRLFSLAASFQDEDLRHHATTALFHIDQLHRSQQKTVSLYDDSLKPLSRQIKQLVESQQSKSQPSEEIRVRLGIQIDDAHFKALINDSQVLLYKDYTKWNWDNISELLQGPLLNPRRLEEIVRSTKFIKRLLAFFRPNTKRFSEIKTGKATGRFVHVGCSLMRVLLGSAEGVKYLCENKFLPHFADCLSELRSSEAVPTESGPFLSQDRLEKTLSGEYFMIIGVLFRYKEGLEILEKFKIFNLLYRLTELKNRDDLVKLILTSMDYTIDGHARVLLSKVMTSAQKPLRLFATNFVRYLLRSNVKNFSEWGVRLLVTQLYDPSLEVCEKAVMVLDEVCQTPEHLEALITYRPMLDHLSEIGNPLLLRFLSSVKGFQFLDEMDYINKEMDFWFQEGNLRYVVQLELSLARALTSSQKNSKTFANKISEESAKLKRIQSEYDGTALSHFYGELTKTEKGCELLRTRGHFKTFAQLIRKAVDMPVDQAQMLSLKAALWATGNIGASTLGLSFLVQEDTIKDIIQIATTSPVLSLRGTCFYVLGMISRNPQGGEILEDLGWESRSPSGTYNGMVVPVRFHQLLSLPSWDYRPHIELDFDIEFAKGKDESESEALKHIGNLSNHILANASSKALSKMKHERPTLFSNFDFYVRVMKIVATYHYRLNARRFLNDLFDRVDLAEQNLVGLQVSDSLYSLAAQAAALASSNASTSAHGLGIGLDLKKRSSVRSTRSARSRRAADDKSDSGSVHQATDNVSEDEDELPKKGENVWVARFVREGFHLPAK